MSLWTNIWWYISEVKFVVKNKRVKRRHMIGWLAHWHASHVDSDLARWALLGSLVSAHFRAAIMMYRRVSGWVLCTPHKSACPCQTHTPAVLLLVSQGLNGRNNITVMSSESQTVLHLDWMASSPQPDYFLSPSGRQTRQISRINPCMSGLVATWYNW